MTNGSMDSVEANLDRLAEVLVQTVERQSVTEYTLQLLSEKADKVVTAAGERIRALVRIAEAHNGGSKIWKTVYTTTLLLG